MSDDLAASVMKLRKSAAQLNQLTDQANQTVKEVEDFLNRECSVGVHAWVKVNESTVMDQNDHECGASYQWLEYRRIGGRYRIAIVWGTDFNPEDETVKPWSDCSREDKLETVAKLPDLIQEVAKKLDEKVATARATAQTVSAVVKALSGKEGA